MNAPIYQVDAFTEKLFGGNPAAVVPLQQWPGDDILQRIAAENNLSETAFFVKRGPVFDLRWFTPAIEVDLCGHATLATAHVLFEHLGYEGDTVSFSTLHHGILKAVKKDGRIVLEFPSTPPAPLPCPAVLTEALGAEPLEVHESRDLMAVFATEEDVRSLKPDHRLLQTLPHLGVIVTAPGTDVDFVSRFFAPNAGIAEDPVTGSAHTTLIPYWHGRTGKKVMRARQVSARGGELFCVFAGHTVHIGGEARTYLTGKISW